MAQVSERLLAEARGNPLALLELSAALSDLQLAGRASLPEALPLTARLRGAFMQQIKALPASAQAALLLASAENEGELRVIRRAATAMGISEDALEPAEEAGLVRVDGRTLTFRHPLVRSAVYGSAPLGRRQSAHRALADALAIAERTDSALWHRAIATDGPDEQVAAALEASGRRSQERGGHGSAASAFERAAALSERVSVAGARMAMAAEAAWGAGQTERARSLVERSLSTSEGAPHVRLLHLSGVIEGRHGWLGHGVATLRRAAALSDEPSVSLQMLREAASMAVYAGDYEQVVAIGQDATRLSPASAADRYIKAALGAYAADLSGHQERGAALAAEALEIADLLDDPMCLISAAHTAARQHGAADGLPYAARARDRSPAGAGQHAAVRASGAGAITDRRQPVRPGLRGGGRRLAARARRSATMGGKSEPGVHGQNRCAARCGGACIAARGGAAGTRGNERRERPRLQRRDDVGALELERGRPAHALDHLVVVLSTARPESNTLFVAALPDAVEAAVRADRLSEVSCYLDRFEAWVSAFPNRARRALLARCRALADETTAELNFEQAVALADALSPCDRARSELLYGEWLRRHRRRRDARTHLRAALHAFGQLGLSPWEERARSELRASGETARRRNAASRDMLTAQELQIARLVADGMSNPDVAGQLFLSPRTIDYHLRKVFTKLEITSRAELAGLIGQ